MANVYHEGDRLVVIHSHELHPPVMPRKYNSVSCGCGGKGMAGRRGRGIAVLSSVKLFQIRIFLARLSPPNKIQDHQLYLSCYIAFSEI